MRRILLGIIVVVVVLIGIGSVAGGGKGSSSPAPTAAATTPNPSDAAEAALIKGNVQDALGLGSTVVIQDGDVFVVTVLDGKTPDEMCSAILAVTNDPNTASPLPLTSVALMDHTGPGGKIIAQCHR